MTMIEIFALLISGAALAVSLVSLYFSTWHKKTSLIGCLVSSGSYLDEDETQDVYEFALSNTGNQALLLREVHVQPVDWKEKELVPVPEIKDIPSVIEPDAVRLIKVPVSNKFINSLAEQSRDFNIIFEFITPKAEVKNATKTIISNLELDEKKESWEAFILE
jgi:hypothetical protein